MSRDEFGFVVGQGLVPEFGASAGPVIGFPGVDSWDILLV